MTRASKRSRAHRRVLVAFLLVGAVLSSAVAALASATPVGPLPNGPVRSVVARANTTFVVNLPKHAGLDWRIARSYRGSVVRQLDEGETASRVWLRFKAVAPGTTSLVFALTRGERGHAFAARTYGITVR